MVCDEELLTAYKVKLREAEIQRDLHADLNLRAAEALGKPSEGEGSSWHDIPERIEQLRRERAQLLRRPTIPEYEDLRERIAILYRESR